MTLQDLIRNFRKQVDDLEQPFLWDDDEALLYAIDAQDMFVRKTGGISDYTTNAVTLITATLNTPLTAISPYILRVRSAKMITAAKSIKVLNEADMYQVSTEDYGYMVPGYLNDAEIGPVQAMVLGIEENSVRWYKVPDVTDTCRMHVYRLPYPRITAQEDLLEIQEQHQFHLIKWMKHLAYSKEDAETYDKTLAEMNKQAFIAYCDEANYEIGRRRFKPRIIQYGGI